MSQLQVVNPEIFQFTEILPGKFTKNQLAQHNSISNWPGQQWKTFLPTTADGRWCCKVKKSLQRAEMSMNTKC